MMTITLFHRDFIKVYENCAYLEIKNDRITFHDGGGKFIESDLKYLIER